jgi:hypothetical protein
VPDWFRDLVYDLYHIYPGAEPTQFNVRAYYLHLGNLPAAILHQAFAAAPTGCPAHMIPSAEIVRQVAMQAIKEQQLTQKPIGV